MNVPLSSVRITFVGGGNMAAALIGGLIARGATAASLAAIDPSPSQRDALASRFGIGVHAAPSAAALAADVVVLAVKPQQMHEAVLSIAPHLRAPLVMSVAAGVRADDLSRWLGGYGRIVRTMPNTPALVGLGATGLAPLAGATAADRALAGAIMGAVGETVWVDDEAKLDAVTALSGGCTAAAAAIIATSRVLAGIEGIEGRIQLLHHLLGPALLAGGQGYICCDSRELLLQLPCSCGLSAPPGLSV